MLLSIDPLCVRALTTGPSEPVGGHVGTIVPFYLSDRGYTTKGSDTALPLFWQTLSAVHPPVDDDAAARLPAPFVRYLAG